MANRKTVRSRRLGTQIRELRLKLLREQGTDTGQERLVKLMNAGRPKQRGVSASHLSRLESGAARMNAEHLRRFIEVLNVPEDKAAELEALRLRADEPGWWQDYSDILEESVEMLVELGEEANAVRTYDNAYVQGLLQTRRYAEALAGNAKAFVRPFDIDRLAELRIRRQQRLGASDFGRITAVLSESVIRTIVGGSEIMREQLEHLLTVGDNLPVTLHVLPFSAGALPGSDNIVIFEFPDELDGEVVYVDGDTAQRIHEEREPVRQCTYIFNAALAQALPARESLDLIRAVQKEM